MGKLPKEEDLSEAELELLASVPLPYSSSAVQQSAEGGEAVEPGGGGVPSINWPVELPQPKDEDEDGWLWSIVKVDQSSRVFLSDAVSRGVFTAGWWVHHYLLDEAVILHQGGDPNDVWESGYMDVARNISNRLDSRGRLTLSANELGILRARPGGRVLVATQVMHIALPQDIMPRVNLFPVGLLYEATLAQGLLKCVR